MIYLLITAKTGRDINKDIIEIRSEKKQKKLAGIVELEMVVELEIDYVRALWNSDFETAVGKTEDILKLI